MASGVTLAQRTYGAVVVEVARRLGLVLAQGTATAGTTTSLTDATNMRTLAAAANDVIGKFLYIYGGTAAGQVREVSAYSTLGVFTWSGAGTAPDTTSTWVLLDADPQYLIDAVSWAQRNLGFEQSVPYDSDSLVTNNLLDYAGDMEEWTSGTSSAPDGWVLAGAGAAVAQSTVNPHGLYAALLTPAAAILTLTYTVSRERLRLLDGASLTLHGYLGEAAAGDGVVRVTVRNAAGTSTNTDRTGTYVYGTSGFERLEDISTASISVPDPVTNVEMQVRFAASASAGRVDDLMLYGPTLWTQELPPSLVALEPTIWMEQTQFYGDYKIPLRHKEHWKLRPKSSTTAREIQWFTPLPSGYHLLIHGRRAPAVVTATATNLNIDADLVAIVAAAHVIGASQDLKAEAAQERRRKSTLRGGRPLIWLEDSLAST